MDYIVCPQGKSQISSDRRKMALAKAIRELKSIQENATEMQEIKDTRSAMKDLESENIEVIADVKTIIAVQYNPPDDLETQI